MRILLFYAMFSTGLLLTVKKPYWGILAIVSFYIVNPMETLLWGHVTNLRPNFIFSVLTLIIFFVKSKRKPLDSIFWALVFFWLTMVFSSFSAAVSSQISFNQNFFFFKIIIGFYLVYQLVNTREEMNLLMWVIIGGMSYYILVTTLSFAMGHNVVSTIDKLGGKGALHGTNPQAAMTVLCIPFLFYRLRAWEYKWEKIIAPPMFFMFCFYVILTDSRGGFLGMGLVIILMILTMKRRILGLIVFLLITGLVYNIYFTDEYKDNLRTISEYEGDKSAENRLVLWKAGLDMLADYPLSGVGQFNFRMISPKYTGIRLREDQVTTFGQGLGSHNTYVEILAEGGVQSLFAFLLLFFLYFKRLLYLRSLIKDNEKLFYEYQPFIYALAIGMVGFLICSIVQVRGYFEPIYWFIALSISITFMIDKELGGTHM